MDLTIKKSKINEMIIYAFVFISVILPGDIFNLKKILFFMICLINVKLIITSLFSKKNITITVFGFIFPTILLVYSGIMTGNIILSFSRSYAAYMLLIIFVVKDYKIDFEKILLKSVKLIMITTILLVILDIIGFLDVNNSFFRNEIMYGYDLGLMGKSPLYPFYYKIFFKTSPLIVFILFKKFNDSKYFTAFLAITALIISGTRANVLFPIFFLIAFYVFSAKNKSKIIKYIFIIFALLSSLFLIKPMIEVFNDAFIVKGEVSDTVRKGHIEGIKELVINDPMIILRGSGMGSEFYSYGTNSYASSFEWSYIDLWRQMGFLFFFLFLLFISFPLFYWYESGKYKKYAYITYLCIAATNPLLFSSTSYLVFIYIYYDSKKHRLIEEMKE